MTSDRDLADRAAAAYAAGARAHRDFASRGEVDDSGGLLRVATGSPAPYFSWLYVVDDDVTAAAVRDAVTWFDARLQPFTSRLRAHQAERYDTTLQDAGLVPELVMPGMVADVSSVDGFDVAGLTVDHVADRPSYDAFTARVAPGGAHTWLTTELYRDFLPPSFVDDPAFAMLIGRIDGEPVANAAARVDRGVVTVFAVGTDNEVRRRGIGRAMTAAAVAWGRDKGADLAFLTSSDMAVPLYESMGFRAVDTWTFYLRVAGRG